MKILKIALLALGGTFALVALVGFFLSSHWRVSREVVVKASPEVLNAFVGDLHRWPEWSEWEQPENQMTYTYAGPAMGPGAAQAWTSPKMGDGSLTVTRQDGAGVALDLVPRAGSAPAKATFRYEKQAGGTRVVWTVDGDVGANPLMHFSVGMIEQMVAESFEKGLARLKTQAEEAQARADKAAADQAPAAAAAQAAEAAQKAEIERAEATAAAHH